jgi:aryl-alcohol dehydrogenase-like predicted oxidoreductase
VSTARSCGFMPPVALQPWYNMVERERFEGELRDAAIRNSLGVFPYYSLANGFLTGKYRTAADLGKSPRGSRSARYLEGGGIEVLRAMDQVAAETGAALATISLAWLMAQPAVTAPIASATSVEQLNELTAALELTLSLDQIAGLDSASAETEPAAA